MERMTFFGGPILSDDFGDMTPFPMTGLVVRSFPPPPPLPLPLPLPPPLSDFRNP
jgi:hypothetical protein